MGIRVHLKEILDAMEFQSDETKAYLHHPTGRVIVVSDQAIRAAERGEDAMLEPLELADTREILARPDDYLPLPDRFEIDEYRMMERFAASMPKQEASEELLSMLQGSGAFRRFKDAVRRLALADEWYAYRDHGYEEVAAAWCEEHGISVDSSAG